ncbi:calphotin-like [Trichoplusia ni]|uniref:Calphotin-like n=1 Tax=Trichoplusia ni TaxID=7111 RepID=A0A7E5WCG8_TRINI|nr:calphotin-like [Trichoplusia ni]
MKYFVAIALIATVASAAYVKPTGVSAELAEIQEIVAAINSPSTNPATAAALEEMLWDVLGVNPEPISVGPAIVDLPAPIVPTPVIVAPSPVAPVPVIVAPTPVAPSPVAIVEGPAAEVDASSAPLVQIILNINQAAAESSPVAPVATPEPVQVIETAPIAVNPVGVVEASPEPVHVVEAAPEPVQVIEAAPEPVVIGVPVIPAPAITLPEELNRRLDLARIRLYSIRLVTDIDPTYLDSASLRALTMAEHSRSHQGGDESFPEAEFLSGILCSAANETAPENRSMQVSRLSGETSGIERTRESRIRKSIVVFCTIKNLKMKYFVAIALIATVASAAYVKPTGVSAELAEIQEIVAAINSPSTNPATAAALEEMLLDVLGVNPEPISVGPAIVDLPAPIVPTPVIVAPSPVAPVPVIIAPTPVAPSPVAIVEGPAADVDAASAPLVQIILNINQAAAESSPVAPVATPEPVQVIETAPIAVNPVGVVEASPEPVQVVEVAPAPVQVIEAAPEPVIIGVPVIPSPAISLPEELN